MNFIQVWTITSFAISLFVTFAIRNDARFFAALRAQQDAQTDMGKPRWYVPVGATLGLVVVATVAGWFTSVFIWGLVSLFGSTG